MTKDFRSIIQFERFKERVRVNTNHCARYINREHAKEIAKSTVLFTIHLPYESLRQWKNAVLKCSCGYIDILNEFLKEVCGHQVKEDSHRVKKRLEEICTHVKRKFVGKNGAAYRKLCESEIHMTVKMEELVMTSKLQDCLDAEKAEKCELLQQATELQTQLQNTQHAVSEKEASLLEAEEELAKLRSTNKELVDYIHRLGQDLNFVNTGKQIGDVGERQQRRKLTNLKTNIRKALWFSETFGLQLKDINFIGEDGMQQKLEFKEKERKSYKDVKMSGISGHVQKVDVFCVKNMLVVEQFAQVLCC